MITLLLLIVLAVGLFVAWPLIILLDRIDPPPLPVQELVYALLYALAGAAAYVLAAALSARLARRTAALRHRISGGIR